MRITKAKTKTASVKKTTKALALPTPPTTVHTTDPHLIKAPVLVALVGCGGNGSQMLTKLARLHYALCLLNQGHNSGLMVAAFDPDRVMHANIGRQMFSPADVGHFKSVILVNRINQYYGTDWVAFGESYTGGVPLQDEGLSFKARPNLIISCVDSARARREIEESFGVEGGRPEYWLDLGNSRDTGQVILGQPESHTPIIDRSPESYEAAVLQKLRLPTVMDLFPDLRSPKFQEDNEPSCSLAEALEKQSLFVNDSITSWAAQLLDDLLRKGEIKYHGTFINLETGRVNPLPVPALPVTAKAEPKQKAVKVAEPKRVAEPRRVAA